MSNAAAAIESDERKTVLIVEDDAEISKLLVRYLSDKYDVRTAGNGADGLREIESSRPDLVLCDVMMPSLDGHSMVRAMRATPGHHPPVIFLTARGKPQDLIEGIQSGARHYLTKPVNLAELGAKIKSALATRR